MKPASKHKNRPQVISSRKDPRILEAMAQRSVEHLYSNQRADQQAEETRETTLLLVGDHLVAEWLKSQALSLSSTTSPHPSPHHSLSSSFPSEAIYLFCLERDPRLSALLKEQEELLSAHQILPCKAEILCFLAQIPSRQRPPLALLVKAKAPKKAIRAQDLRPGERSLVLDGLQDPGNVGTLLRSAECFGFYQVIALQGSCHLYASKVLSAARGSPFRLELAQGIERGALQKELQKSHTSLLLASSNQGSPSLSPALFPLKTHLMLVIGHESRGVCSSWYQLPPPTKISSLMIAMRSQVDSLNAAVAGAILMHQVETQESASAAQRKSIATLGERHG